MRQKRLDWRGVALATVGGAAILGVAAQLLAKPSLPPVARAAPRPAGARAAQAPAVQVESVGDRAQPVEAPIRELFRPLVVPPKPVEVAPVLKKPVPVLPSAAKAASAAKKAKKPAKPLLAHAAPHKPAAPQAPQGPRLDDLKMMGVVEMDGKPQVLLKKSSTGESRYFGSGDEAFGFKVEQIEDSGVSLSWKGKTEKLGMSTDIPVESPGGTSSVGGSGFSRDAGRGGRSSRGGGDAGGGGSSAFSTAQLFSLPTWTERLKKLEELKSQVEPAQYERLHTFMAERAKQEKGK
jgi:hypothetical protein